MRPSISTCSLLSALFIPRALIAQVLAVTRATSRFGASRSASGRLVTPARRMSALVMTYTDAGALDSGSARPDTDVISMLPRSSSEKPASDSGRRSATWAAAGIARESAASATASAAGRGGLATLRVGPRRPLGMDFAFLVVIVKRPCTGHHLSVNTLV